MKPSDLETLKRVDLATSRVVRQELMMRDMAPKCGPYDPKMIDAYEDYAGLIMEMVAARRELIAIRRRNETNRGD